MIMSGLVAVLDENGNFLRTQDLGDGVETKPGRVFPLEQYKKNHPENFVEVSKKRDSLKKEIIPETVVNKLIIFFEENPDIAEIVGIKSVG